MRYIIGLFVALGLLILLLVLLLTGGKSGTPKTPKPLYSYANSTAEAQLTIDGPVNADQNHQQIQITVGRDEVTYEQLKGYDGEVVNLQTFNNTVNAYTVFLRSLSVAGFREGNNSPTLSNEQGYCSLGDRYIFEFTQDDSTIERYWATSCGSPKTYLGDLDLTLTLFQNQVPNYNALTQNINL